MARNELNFTKENIVALPLPEPGARQEYYDTKVQGLQIRVTANGVKTFYVYRWVRAEGKAERIMLGRFPDMTIENARKAAAKVNGAIAEGHNPAAALRGKRAELTLGELFLEYQDRHLSVHCKPRVIKETPELFQRFLGELPAEEQKRKPHGARRSKHPAGVHWQNRALSSITLGDVSKLHADIGRHGHKTPANKVVTLISSMYNRARDWGLYAGVNPATGVKKFREVKRERFIQSDELPRFFQAVREEPSKDVRDFVLVSLLTGARKSDVISMRWQDVSLERGEWRVPDPKNSTPYSVLLTNEAVAILRSRLPDDNDSTAFVFPSDSKTGFIDKPKKGWARILERAGISDLRIHDLRRSLGSWQAKSGASLAIIGKSLGHKTAAATMIYARLDQDPVRASVEKATAAMLQAAGVKGRSRSKARANAPAAR